LSDRRILDIIEELEQTRKRRMMFVGSNSSSELMSYLMGFQNACTLFGLPLPYKWRLQAVEERGWSPSAEAWSVSEMRERGLADEAIADEILAIDIAAWRRMAQAGAV